MEAVTDVVPTARGGSKLMRRLDSAAASVNPFLTLIAIGLATITLASLLVLAIRDALPPITRVNCPAPTSVPLGASQSVTTGAVDNAISDRPVRNL
jgi:hypothetical protein